MTFGAIELLRAARPTRHCELAPGDDRDTSGVLVSRRAPRGADRAAER